MTRTKANAALIIVDEVIGYLTDPGSRTPRDTVVGRLRAAKRLPEDSDD